MKVTIKKATLNDLEDIKKTCKEAILYSCSNDYSTQQIQAWIDAIDNLERWEKAIENQFFIAAWISDEMAGFGSILNGEYIDFLYVSPKYLGKGIANHLFNILMDETRKLGKQFLWANVSKTALPFFSSKGFVIEKENRNQTQGVEIMNYRMGKKIEIKWPVGI